MSWSSNGWLCWFTVLVTLTPKLVVLKLLGVTDPFHSDSNHGYALQTSTWQEFGILATFSSLVLELRDEREACE